MRIGKEGFGRHCHIAVQKTSYRAGSMLTGRPPTLKNYSTLLSGCNDLPPCLKSILSFGVVLRSRKEMSFRSEVSGQDIVHLENTLPVLRRLEALHPALSLSGWLMRVLGSIV